MLSNYQSLVITNSVPNSSLQILTFSVTATNNSFSDSTPNTDSRFPFFCSAVYHRVLADTLLYSDKCLPIWLMKKFTSRNVNADFFSSHSNALSNLHFMILIGWSKSSFLYWVENLITRTNLLAKSIISIFKPLFMLTFHCSML